MKITTIDALPTSLFINGVFEENIHAAKQSERKLRTVFSHRAEPGT